MCTCLKSPVGGRMPLVALHSACIHKEEKPFCHPFIAPIHCLYSSFLFLFKRTLQCHGQTGREWLDISPYPCSPLSKLSACYRHEQQRVASQLVACVWVFRLQCRATTTPLSLDKRGQFNDIPLGRCQSALISSTLLVKIFFLTAAYV